jgi:CRP-like cAMP-binding protein
MTTVGYGDIQGDSFLEIIFRLILLAIGIIVYSWLISSISNSINKESFASINYSNECKILEQIRKTHRNLPYSLYWKIIRYLKDKHFYQTKYDKNLLIMSLPYTLKNDLYLSMYKLTLERFYFFKGISNTNFLVEILSYYSPKTASKDEILIKEGDIIEEIIYVREGKLSLEIPINIDNPEESINKYLSYDFLEYAFDLDYSHKINQNNNNTNLSICSNKSNISFIQVNTYNKNNEKEEIIDNNIHLKVHNIFKNEDYGSIFMFFGKRSPFAVRVKSKKVKLFVLKKSDFSKLCSQYKNVIRRIQKKKKKNIKKEKRIFINRKTQNINQIFHLYK